MQRNMRNKLAPRSPIFGAGLCKAQQPLFSQGSLCFVDFTLSTWNKFSLFATLPPVWEQAFKLTYHPPWPWWRAASEWIPRADSRIAMLEQWLRQSSLTKNQRGAYSWQLERSDQILIIWSKNIVATFIEKLDITEFTMRAW